MAAVREGMAEEKIIRVSNKNLGGMCKNKHINKYTRNFPKDINA